MKNLLKPIAAMGTLMALAAASQAGITFGNFVGNGTPFLTLNGPGVLKFEPNVSSSGSGSYTGSFSALSDAGFKDVDVSVGSNLVVGGLLSYNVAMNGGVDSIYDDVVSSDGGSLAANGPSKSLYRKIYTVTYALSYTGDAGSFTSFTASTLTFHDLDSTPPAPIPEPASYVALGVGAWGLIVRRRRAR